MLKRFLFIVTIFLAMLANAQDTSNNAHTSAPVVNSSIMDQQIISGRKNSPEQMSKPYVILISADGFRADFTELESAGLPITPYPNHFDHFGFKNVPALRIPHKFPATTDLR